MKKPEAPVHTMRLVDLESLEKAIYGRDHNAAGLLLLEAMRRMRMGAEFAWKKTDKETRDSCYARLAAAIGAYIADPGFTPSDEGYVKLSIETSLLTAIFESSPLQSADYLARVLADNPDERDASKLEFSTLNLAKWLIFCGINSSIGLNYEELFSKAARTVMPLWAAMLAGKVVFTYQAMERKNELLSMGRYFQELDVPDEALAPLSDAYMHCSYATSPDRHAVKPVISGMLRRAISKRIALPPEHEFAKQRSETRGAERPKMLIPIEWFGSFHAMHRCWAPAIMELRTKFHLTACARSSGLDEGARKYFDDVMPLPEGPFDFAGVVSKILARKPDIIYYPSIGMAMWWTSLASVRLAPIQVMSLGHPASSFSQAMDYVLAEEDQIPHPELFSEIPVLVPTGAGRFTERPDYEAHVQSANLLAEEGMPIRIAIPAVALKLNPLFFDSLTRIEFAAKKMGKQIRFSFFPNMLGAEHRYATMLLEKMFEGCLVYPRVAAPKYLEWLAGCDFALAPFPFGGTNSTVDALLLGMPVVALKGRQPHELFDSLLLERVGLGGELVADSVDRFEEICIALLDADYRGQMVQRVRCSQCSQEFYGPRKGDSEGAWARAMWHLWINHEEIKMKRQPVTWREFT